MNAKPAGRETVTFDYGIPAELFMGKRKGGARQPLRYRRFATAAEAIRFAIEELPAVRALGAWMQVGDQRFNGDDIQRLYESNDYPLARLRQRPCREYFERLVNADEPPREMFAANSEQPGQRRPTGRGLPLFGHRDQAFALSLFPGSLARTSNGFCLLAGLALRRFFIRLATLHLTKNALALHLLL